MTVFITSSPFVEGADRAILSNANGFVDRLRAALPEYGRLLFVASDPERHDLTCRFATDLISACAGAGIYFSSFQILDWATADCARDLVENSDFLVLAGGHVPTQNAFFREIELRQILEKYSGTVMGISAGSMNLADTVYVQPELDGESAPDFPRFAPGLGLTAVNILPHYQQVRRYMLDGKRLFEDITYPDSLGHIFFAIPDGSYFYQDDTCLLLYGRAYLIRDGRKTPLTEDGDTFDMGNFA